MRLFGYPFSTIARIVVALLFLQSYKASAETYVIASQNFNYYPHYNFLSESDKGFIWAVLEQYAHDNGHEFIYVSLPVRRLQTELVKGTVDLIYPDNPIFHPDMIEPENKIYSGDIVQTLSAAIISNNQREPSADDVKNISLPVGFEPLDWKGRVKNGKISLIETPDSFTALRLVEKGEADVAEVDFFVSQYLSHSSPSLGNFTVAHSLPFNVVGFKLATIKQADLLHDINNYVLEHPTMMTSLKARYGITDPYELVDTLAIAE